MPAFEPGSFRDRHARIFRHGDRILRTLSQMARDDWERLSATRLFERRTADGTIVKTRRPPDEATLLASAGDGWCAVVEHERVPFISYPYEWTFGMLREAALLHLDLTREAIEEGLILKDATPYNVQFVNGRAVFIDTASFTRLVPGEPWQGYRQFCRLFLYPLMLQAYKDAAFQPWLRGSLEGIEPRDMRGIVGTRDLLRSGVLTHVVLQAGAEARLSSTTRNVRAELKQAGFSAALIVANLRRLRRLVAGLEWKRRTSAWSEYAGANTYSADDAARKEAFVRRAAAARSQRVIWDLGANTGHYSRVVAPYAECVVALDADALAVERLRSELRERGPSNILPLVGNVLDPSPGLGWRGDERVPLERRGAPDLTLALALVHHVVIAGNVPLPEFIDWLARLGGDLVIEFVSKDDEMVRQLLLNKDDQYDEYTRDVFERTLRVHFDIVATEEIQQGGRVLYHAIHR
jgi:precorrin-6B methylase 2